MGRFVNSVFILRNFTAFAGATLAGCFVAYSILYWTLARDLGNSYRGAFYLMKTLREGAGPVVWFAVTLYGIVISIFVLAIALFATHKVAGPLFRLELLIGRALAGDLPESVQFRTRDQLAPLAESIGGLISVLRDKEAGLTSLAEEMDGKIKSGNPGWVESAGVLRKRLSQFSETARSKKGAF